MTPDGHQDPTRAARRRLLRKASLYTYGFFLAAVLVAALGAGLLTLLLRPLGLPLIQTWIALVVLLIAIPVIGIGLRRRAEDEDG